MADVELPENEGPAEEPAVPEGVMVVSIMLVAERVMTDVTWVVGRPELAPVE
jgi:hypothetical protein